MSRVDLKNFEQRMKEKNLKQQISEENNAADAFEASIRMMRAHMELIATKKKYAKWFKKVWLPFTKKEQEEDRARILQGDKRKVEELKSAKE